MNQGRLDSSGWQDVERIFRATIERPVGQRAVYLDQACGGDHRLRALVAALLDSHGRPGDKWDDPRGADSDGAAQTRTPRSARVSFEPGQLVGRYRLVREISHGGMGTVFEAVQDRPERTVALKVLRRDVLTGSALSRFELESRVLARLRHSAIAQVYDAGTVEIGGVAIPFIAMEHIPGAHSVVVYAVCERLGLRQRLTLFSRVCNAVQHAHTQGVIHRDLKPANILVDSSGAPKVIDFGVARLVEQDVAVTRHTSAGQIIGTVAYMSPEQCAADSAALDTRSDVYALEVVLYELLSGQLPYRVDGATFFEAMRIIRERAPTLLGMVNRAYRGDLETIVGKALEKDKERRYQSAGDLAADITRFLADEPIVARPPSTIYKLRKFAKRHTGLVASAAVIVTMLVAAVAVITPLYFSAERAREDAEAARISQSQARGEAETSRDEAELEVQRQEAVIEFLGTMLRSADPFQTRGEDLTVKEMLDSAARSVADELDDRPAVRASVERAIGLAYNSLGAVHQASEHIDKALALHRTHLANEPVRLAGMLVITADARRVEGRYSDALALCEEALDVLGGAADRDSEKARALRASALRERGVALVHRSRLEAALADFMRAYEIEKSLPDSSGTEASLATTAEAIGNAHQMLGHNDEAATWYDRTVELQIRADGPDSPTLAYTYGNYASLLEEMGQLDRAETMIRDSLRIWRKLFGGGHQNLSIGLTVLGDILADEGRVEEMSRCFEEALEIDRRVFGQDHPDPGINEWRYGLALVRVGHVEEGESRMRNGIQVLNRALGPSDPMTQTMIGDTCRSLIEYGAFDVGERLLREQQELVDDDASIIDLLKQLREAAAAHDKHP